MLYTLFVLNIFKRVGVYFLTCYYFGNKRFSDFSSHVYSRSALTRISTRTQNRLQRYKKKLNYANILAKKCQKNAASTNLGRYITTKKTLKRESFLWYPEPGSNRHGLLHWCLRPARLPIPPSGQTFVHCGKLLCINFPLKSPKITCRARCFLRAEKGGFEPPVRLPVRQFSKLLV